MRVNTHMQTHKESFLEFVNSINLPTMDPDEMGGIDVFFPSKNVGVTFITLNEHSELQGGKARNFHKRLTDEYSKLGWHILQIYETEWINNPHIIKDKINHVLRNKPIEKKIYARECEVTEISSKDKNDFLFSVHRQGLDRSSIKYGLYHEGKLVAVMTFGKPRIALGRKTSKGNIQENHYELLRYGVSDVIIGGASKLLSRFIKDHNPSEILTFADRRYSTEENFYTKIGFKLESTTLPNYWYFKVGETDLLHRFNFRKDQLPKKLAIFDVSLSEWTNMKVNGYDRIWDSGNYKYVWKPNKK